MVRLLLVIAILTMVLPGGASATRFEVPTLSVRGSGDATITLTVTVGEMGAPTGFTIEWMRLSDFITHDGWSMREVASFVGEPTANAWGASGSFTMDGQGSVTVEISDLFDETGVVTTTTDELDSSTLYVFRAYVNDDGTIERSDYSEPLTAGTTGDEDCTHTQGYWKNHEEDWSGVSLELGMVTYSAAELDAIFETPAKGNGSLILAHQLIAALLNVVVLGADPFLIQDAIDDAQALLDTCGADPLPPHGTCFIEPSDASPIAQILDDFNNTSDGNCATSVERSSWGSIKAAYR